MSTPNDVIRRTSQILARLPFTQSPDSIRAFLISAGLTEVLNQIDFYGKAPDTFWTNLIWDLWRSGNTDLIETLLYESKERVGIDIRSDLDDILDDFKLLIGTNIGNIYKGELWNFLSKDVQASVQKIRLNSRKLFLKNISSCCSDYVEHSIDNPDRVISMLNNWLLDEEQKDYLQENEWMIFFLYSSIYLYNIGLCHLQGVTDNISSENNRKTLMTQSGSRGSFFIKNHWKLLGIDDSFQANILSKICAGQDTLPLDSKELQIRIPYQQTGKHINLQFIVACLRLVNQMDLTQSRIGFLIESFLPENTRVNPEQIVFAGIGPDARYIDTISAYFQCHSIEVHRALKQHEGFVQNTLNEINRNLTPRFKFTQVVYDIESIGYQPVDFKFRVEASAALEIFMGNPIYTNKATFLRELIQNSIDACDVRRIYEPSVIPEIYVIKHPDNRTVTVKDNGIGMNKAWIEKYFLAIGISFYRSEEFENINSLDVGFAPISRFGIGILSCFMVAEKIIIRTKKLNSRGIKIEIPDFRNYFTVTEDDLIEQGTEIKVILKSHLDCLGFLLESVKCTKYPIEYRYYDGERRTIAQEPVSIVEKLKLQFWNNLWENFIEKKIPLKYSEGYIAVQIAKSADSSLNPGSRSNCEVHILQDGIYICNEPMLLPKWAVKNFVARINLVNNDRVDLSISRIGILQNAKYDILRKKIEMGLILLLEDIFERLKSFYHKREDFQPRLSAFIKGTISIIDDANLLRLLQNHYYFTLLTKDYGFHGYYKYNELFNVSKVVILRHESDFTSENLAYYKSNTYYIVGTDAVLLMLLDKDKKFVRFRS